MSCQFHNLDNYIFEKFNKQQKIDEYLEQIDTTKLEPIDLQNVEYKAWKLAEESRPETAESWGCGEGLVLWLFEQIPQFQFGTSGLSGDNKAIVVENMLRLSSVYQSSDINLSSKLVIFDTFIYRHPVVFSY